MIRKQRQNWLGPWGAQVIIVLLALGILGVGLGIYSWWWHRHRAAGRPLASPQAILTDPVSPPAAASGEPSEPPEAQVNLVPVWHKITAERSESVPSTTLAFTLDGERVTRLRAGSEYYLVDRDAFEHFVPHDRDDLVKLQLPDTTLRPLGPTASFVELAASWYVPADIEGELHYRVHYLVDTDRQPGELIEGPFTIWLTPWLDYQRDGI